jgi:hypothetical protein
MSRHAETGTRPLSELKQGGLVAVRRRGGRRRPREVVAELVAMRLREVAAELVAVWVARGGGGGATATPGSGLAPTVAAAPNNRVRVSGFGGICCRRPQRRLGRRGCRLVGGGQGRRGSLPEGGRGEKPPEEDKRRRPDSRKTVMRFEEDGRAQEERGSRVLTLT